MKLDDLIKGAYEYEASNIYTSEMKQNQVLQKVIETGKVKKHKLFWAIKENIKDGLSNVKLVSCLEVIAICLIIGLMPILFFLYMSPNNRSIVNPGAANMTSGNQGLGESIKGFNEGSSIQKKLEADIDNDGIKEAVVLFKDKKVFVFKNVNNSYTNLGEIKTTQPLSVIMSINDIEFIKLDNSKKQYIWITIGDAYDNLNSSWHGLKVCSVSGNRVVTNDEEIPDDIGNIDIILKLNQNSTYDKVISTELGDFEKHCLVKYFRWDGSKFNFDRTEIIYKNELNKFIYPDEPSDIINSFINAKLLKLQNEIDKFTYNKDYADFPIQDYYQLSYSAPHISDDILLQNDKKIICKVYTNSSKSDKSELYFVLVKSSAVWKIQSISIEQPVY